MPKLCVFEGAKLGGLDNVFFFNPAISSISGVGTWSEGFIPAWPGS